MVRVTITRHHTGPSPVAVVAIVVGLLMRFGFGPWVMLLALTGMLH